MWVLLWFSCLLSSVSSQTLENRYVEVGHDLFIPCHFVRQPSEPAYWYKVDKNNEEMIFNQWLSRWNAFYAEKYWVDCNGGDWHNLTIIDTLFDDDAVYRCANLNITYLLIEVTVYERYTKKLGLTAKVGDRVILPCYFEQGIDTVYWYSEYTDPDAAFRTRLYQNMNNQQEITFPDRHEILLDGQIQHSLVIKSANFFDSRVYRCVKHDVKRNKVITYSLVELNVEGQTNIKETMETKIGEAVTFTCNPHTNSSAQVLKWLRLEGGTSDVLYTYQNSTEEVSYPNLHKVSSDEFGLWHNLTIKRVTSSDAGIYLCNQTEPLHFEAEVDLSVSPET